MAFLPRSKRLLISWLQSLSAVILEPPKIKSVTVSIVSLSFCQEVMELDAKMLVFWRLSFNPTFSLSSFTFIKRFFSSSFSGKSSVICTSEAVDISPSNLDSGLCFSQPSISHDVLYICWQFDLWFLCKRVPEKHLFLLYWLCQSLWLCGSQWTVENSERDGNSRPPDLPLEKPIYRSGGNS